jgi:CheY-like chemotaxis protein
MQGWWRGGAFISAGRCQPIPLFLKYIVVLDLMLPGNNGLEVARRLKTDPRTTGLTFVTLTAKGGEWATASRIVC